MKSNSNYHHHCRKNIKYHQDERGIGSSSNINNFSSDRYDKCKIHSDKSFQKYINNQNKVENRYKNKDQLKKQLNIIMHDAKIRKAYSPSSVQNKLNEDNQHQNKGLNKLTSPQNAKTSAYKMRSRQKNTEKKKMNVIPQQGTKKAPTWLNKKMKNDPNMYHNSITKYQKNKSRQIKNDSQKQLHKNNFNNQNSIKRRSNLQTAPETNNDESKNSLSYNNDWKRIYDNHHQKNKNSQLNNQNQFRDQINNVQTNTNFQINKVILEKQINELKFQLQNALQDKNILINRLETIEIQLSISNRKIEQWNKIQTTFRQNEKVYRSKIAQLQSQLLTSRQRQNRQLASDINKFYGQGAIYDRQILSKKNQQISRLNEMIISTRNKITQVNNQYTRQKIKNIKFLQNFQSKYQSIIQQKQKQIQDLKVQLQRLKSQIYKMTCDVQEKNKIIRNHLINQIAKEQDSTYIHSFIDKYLNEQNIQCLQFPITKMDNLIVNSPSSHI